MKSSLSRVLALSLLVCASLPSWAQPPVAVPEPATEPAQEATQEVIGAPLPDESTQYALALIGAFVDKMRHAKGFRGRVTAIGTTLKKGQIVSIKTYDIQTSWLSDVKHEDGINKNFSKIVSSLETNNEKIVEVFSCVDDSTKAYLLDETKNVWSEGEHDAANTPFPLRLTRSAWVDALMAYAEGNEFKIEHQLFNGQDKILVTCPAIKYVFDATNGNLQSFSLSYPAKKIEYRWLETEFDVPLPDSLFVWKVPDGATKVAPESTKIDIKF